MRKECAQWILRAIKINKSEESVWIDLTIESARKLVVEPSTTVGLGLRSAAIHDISLSLHSDGVERIKPWLVRPAKESACKSLTTAPTCSVFDTASRQSGEKALRSASCRCETSRHAARFTVERCPMRCESFVRHPVSS